ncbi:helix-turn-helix transcriptional regulator, partial [Klebsiella pneumoniae]
MAAPAGAASYRTVSRSAAAVVEVMHLCGLSRSTIYDLISREAFP